MPRRRREIGKKQFEAIVRQHELWVKSEGKDGARAEGFSGVDLSDVEVDGADLSSCDLSGAKLIGATFRNTNLSNANFAEADLSNAAMRWVNAKGINFWRATLSDMEFVQTDLREAIFRKSFATGAFLEQSNMSGADMGECVARYAEMDKANLSGANLEKADMVGVKLNHANLSGANLENAKLAGSEFSEANLSGASLFGANLADSDFDGANLAGANLVRANLEIADFGDAYLVGANLGNNENAPELEDAILTEPSVEPPRTTYGPWRQAAKALKKVTKPMKLAAFQKAFPEAYEQMKDDVDTGTLDPDVASELLSLYGLTWQISKTQYKDEFQRISPEPNDVIQMNVDPALLTDDPGVLRTIEAIRRTSISSGHPVSRGKLFTIGWIRYSVFPKGKVIRARRHIMAKPGPGSAKVIEDVLLVEEVQSDLPIVRKGMSDPELQANLKKQGLTQDAIKKALDALNPFVMFFYQDALSLIFDIAHEAGYTVEMLSYDQKEAFGSPRSLYEDLPRSMGMRKVKWSKVISKGRVWTIKPNPTKRASKVRVPKTWSRVK